MSFLAPMFLLGGLAIGLPIAFHLIRRTTKERIPFSTLMFLEPSQPKVTKRSRIEHWLLLLLRCLVFLLVAAAFARPFLVSPIETSLSTADMSRTIVLLDTSASMRRDGMWDAAKDRVREVVEELEPQDIVSVFQFDRTSKRLLSFDEWRQNDESSRETLLEQRVEGAAPSWFHTDLGSALITAADLFEEEESLEEDDSFIGRKQIIVVTDLQSGTRFQAVQGYDWPDDIKTTVSIVESSAIGNATMQWSPVEENLDENKQSEKARVLVSNAENSESSQLSIYWTGAESEALSIFVPPGQSRILFSPNPPSDGTGSTQLSLKGDLHGFDNRVNVVLPKSATTTLLYQGSEPETDTRESLFYLNRVFAGSIHPKIEVIQSQPGVGFAPDAYKSSEILIVAGALESTTPAETMLKMGKTVILLGGQVLADEKLSTVLKGPTPYMGPGTVRRYALLGDISFTHPIFSFFAEPKFSDFSTIHFWSYSRLNSSVLDKSNVLAKFDNGDPAMIEASVGTGTVILFASGWRPDESELARSTKFVPLLFSLLDYRGVRRIETQQFVVGESLPVRELLNVPSDTVTITKPDSSQVVMTESESDFDGVDEPGVYVASAGSVSQEFAVNLDPRESQLIALEPDHLATVGVALERDQEETILTEDEARLLANSELEGRQKWWRWLVAIAVGLLFFESIFASRLTRQPQSA
jgi:Mg-chelatase subunit ChlD